MSTEIRNLEPKALWNKFSDLNAVPRPSKKEEKIIEFMMGFGKSLGLTTRKDEVGNVIIKKAATEGMENHKTVVLQSHLDMVCQKNSDTTFNFETQGIEMLIDNGWVKAKGTTLGADNGIGVATIMAILESKDIPHPPLEALFTIDEETGMTGAMGLKAGELKGEILLNLDTEEDTELDIGCAGGVDVTAKRTYRKENTPSGSVAYKITIKGLNGGHSGMDIHKGLGNANKLMNRILHNLLEDADVRIHEINGGSLRNAIPRESTAVITVPNGKVEELKSTLNKKIAEIKSEFSLVEKGLLIITENCDTPGHVMNAEAQRKIIHAIYTAHNGVYRMSAAIPNLVETSNNIARVLIENGEITIQCLTRSSVESSKFDLAQALRSAFELAECEVIFAGSYPGWTPNVNSPILTIMVNLYEKMNKEKPKVVACHAGLECGILGRNYPEMDMISFGPTIKGAHSPDERVNIASVQKYWNYVQEILKNIPKK